MRAATSSLPVARTREALATELRALRRSGATLGLVPTMGSLHPGHLSLVQRAAELADATVVSVFVNRLQFGAGEDFDAYPRDLGRDVELAAAHGAHLVFAPAEREMYPAGEPRVRVDPGPMGAVLCGRHRPGHFRGVLTVVAKLFGLVRPDLAVHGRKDFQQCVLIERMIRDLDLGVRLVVAPTVRDPDGLALSSRNGYLSPAERGEAARFPEALLAARDAFRRGERNAGVLLRIVDTMFAARPALRLQYAECVDPATLAPVARVRAGTVLAAAAFSGRTRLIDNIVLEAAADAPARGGPSGSGG